MRILIMRRWTSLLAIVILPMFGRSLAAQKYESGVEYEHCIANFYDPAMYNWWSAENKCGTTLTVVVCGQLRGGCFSMDLKSGRKDSIGESRSEINEMGGVY